jgi:hypothetical protein
MSGQSAVKTRKEVVAGMRDKDCSTSSNKTGRYSGGEPTTKNNNANKKLKHDGSSRQKA